MYLTSRGLTPPQFVDENLSATAGINYAKSFSLLKRQKEEVPVKCMRFSVKERVRYLEVMIGHVNAEQANTPALPK